MIINMYVLVINSSTNNMYDMNNINNNNNNNHSNTMKRVGCGVRSVLVSSMCMTSKRGSRIPESYINSSYD